MTSTIACEEGDRREFNLIISEHSIKTNRNYTQAEMFKLLLETWRDKHGQI